MLLVHSQGTHWLVLSLSARYLYFFFRASICGSLPKVLLRGSRANVFFSSIYAITFVCSFQRSFLPTPSCGGVIGGAASAFRHLVSMTFKDLINPSILSRNLQLFRNSPLLSIKQKSSVSKSRNEIALFLLSLARPVRPFMALK